MPVPQPLVTRSEKVMSGAVVFAGTRVPVQTLIDYVEEEVGDDFLEDFSDRQSRTRGGCVGADERLCDVACESCLTSVFLAVFAETFRTRCQNGRKWAGPLKKTVELLALAAPAFDAFITTGSKS